MKADKERIIGVWRLVSVRYEDQATKETWPVLGEHPRGSQIATKGGRWTAVVTADGRKIPKTDAERADALRSMIAYTGRYRDRKSTRLNSSHIPLSRMPSSA